MYHGPSGIKEIAQRIHSLTAILARSIEEAGVHQVVNKQFFDTLLIKLSHSSDDLISSAQKKKINIRKVDKSHVAITLDETVTKDDLFDLVVLFKTSSFEEQYKAGLSRRSDLVVYDLDKLADSLAISKSNPSKMYPAALARTSEYLTHPVFNSYHSETDMLRYMHHLQSKDLSLVHAMIPLGSCTMKLNATAEMVPVTWPEFNNLHPFVPTEQAQGYHRLFKELDYALSQATGFDKVSLQPNSGAQGEYTGLRVIQEYLKSIGQSQRNVCIIPVSAHGTNPASAAMCGLDVVIVKCDQFGNLDLEDLRQKIDRHKDRLAATMITYPSTYGVFEEAIKDVCSMIHEAGGQVYMDGANLNAQMGLCNPAEIGADVCHLNLHKTL